MYRPYPLYRRLPRNMFRKCGMTLIEIMISIAILAAIMVFAWGSFALSASKQERMQEINERLHGVEQAVNRIVRDMSMAFMTVHGNDKSQTEER